MKSKNSKRLDSIKAAHRVERTKSSSRMEDYLEIISELVELKGYATTLDISRYMIILAICHPPLPYLFWHTLMICDSTTDQSMRDKMSLKETRSENGKCW